MSPPICCSAAPERWRTALLRAVPQARMVVGAIPSEQFRNMLLGWFAEEGITAESLNSHDITSTSDYLALHRLVDVCLDTALQAQDKDALAVLQRAVKLSPADAQAHGNPGNACQDAGDYRAAIECYRRTLSLSKRWPKYRFDGAATHYRQARALAPDAPQ
jgi:tetratricopeptide (TPR) repeat protein